MDAKRKLAQRTKMQRPKPLKNIPKRKPSIQCRLDDPKLPYPIKKLVAEGAVESVTFREGDQAAGVDMYYTVKLKNTDPHSEFDLYEFYTPTKQ